MVNEKEEKFDKPLGLETKQAVEKSPASSKEEKIKANPSKPSKHKYPIILVAESYIVYRDDNGNNVWVRVKPNHKYVVAEQYEAIG